MILRRACFRITEIAVFDDGELAMNNGEWRMENSLGVMDNGEWRILLE